jgi:hypothetical protein
LTPSSGRRSPYARQVRDKEAPVADLRVSLDEILPIKEAARILPRVLDRLESKEAEHFLITRRSKPAAVLVGLDRYHALLRAEGLAAG